MKIYIDSDFKCHAVDDGTMRGIETDFFNGKCHDFIEGYRFVPQGETWVDEDGIAYDGEMISPCVKTDVLDAVQIAVSRTQAEADEQISTLLDTIEELIIGG